MTFGQDGLIGLLLQDLVVLVGAVIIELLHLLNPHLVLQLIGLEGGLLKPFLDDLFGVEFLEEIFLFLLTLLLGLDNDVLLAHLCDRLLLVSYLKDIVLTGRNVWYSCVDVQLLEGPVELGVRIVLLDREEV